MSIGRGCNARGHRAVIGSSVTVRDLIAPEAVNREIRPSSTSPSHG
jgi:hypothetical protein